MNPLCLKKIRKENVDFLKYVVQNWKTLQKERTLERIRTGIGIILTLVVVIR